VRHIKKNAAARDLWNQIFCRLKEREDATLWDPNYDRSRDRTRLRKAFREAGWSEAEAEERIRFHDDFDAQAPEPASGINPGAQVLYQKLWTDIEAAMDRLGLQSHHTVMHGIEPLGGPFATKTNVIMTNESIITVGAHLFRFCGLIARAFFRTLWLNPYFWSSDNYDKLEGELQLVEDSDLSLYWIYSYLSYALTGTNAYAPFKPAKRHEISFEQIARAMEIFAISHEYGHHDKNHGRGIDLQDSHAEEFEADQFALRICQEVERYPVLFANPYLPSGAGGAILLMAMETLRRVQQAIGTIDRPIVNTHPDVLTRIARFDSVAALQPAEFLRLKNFRTTAVRIMSAAETIMFNLVSPEDFAKLREFAVWVPTSNNLWR
jgi:hypothetical protein